MEMQTLKCRHSTECDVPKTLKGKQATREGKGTEATSHSRKTPEITINVVLVERFLL